MPASPSKRPSPAACTIITRCYLSHARILIESYHRHEPGGQFYLLVVDGLPDGVNAGANVRMIALEDLQLPYLNELLFKYDVVEFCTAIKPTLLAMLMNRFDEKRVLFIDPDIMIARPMDEVFAALDHSSIVLTPHLLRPQALDGQHPNDQDILMAGAYNLGFIGLSKTTQTMDFLKWWEDRLREGCRIDPATGLMTDQKWIDLVPGLFSSTTILRDDTYNVAYWNINARRVIRGGNQFLVNARPLAFFHFSNFDPGNPLGLSRDHGRGPVTKGTGLADLLELYARLQIEKGYRTSIEWKYQRATFDNGIAISAPVRKLYLNLSPSTRLQFGNPFETGADNSFFNWATSGQQNSGQKGGLTPFLSAVYESRSDLQGAFPDINGEDRDRFLHWAQNTGPKEMGYDPRLVQVEESGAAIDQPTMRPILQPVEYPQLVLRLKEIVRHSLPADAVVAVISKGDRQLLDLEGRSARHFPQTETGQYAGHYPRDGADALEQLESQRQQGAEYLIIPATSLWWLDHYAEMNRHLQEQCQLIADEPGICRIFSLGKMAAAAQETAEQRIDRILQQRATQVAELLAENVQLRSNLNELEMLQRGKPFEDVTVFWRSENATPPIEDPPQTKPRLLSTGDIRWLSHDTTGRLISILLPVHISTENLNDLLPRLASQKSVDCIEVIGFLVGTSEALQKQFEDFGVTVIGLTPADPRVINQNSARNLAAKYARGKILIFLGKQTVPADDQWLTNLVVPLDENAKIAAVCSELRVSPSRSLRYAEEPDRTTNNPALRRTSKTGLVGSESDFHLESTAIRAEVLRSIPFTKFGFIDGRAWAHTAQRAGFSVLRQPSSIALHTPPPPSMIQDLCRGISDGIIDQQPPTIPNFDELPPDQTARSLGRWLGQYLNFTSPLSANRDGSR